MSIVGLKHPLSFHASFSESPCIKFISPETRFPAERFFPTGKCSSYNMNDIAQNDTLFVSGHFDSEGTSSYDVTKALKSMCHGDSYRLIQQTSRPELYVLDHN